MSDAKHDSFAFKCFALPRKVPIKYGKKLMADLGTFYKKIIPRILSNITHKNGGIESKT